ncbi:MAG: hypothetical protein CVT77_16995 [Alphaproteobacteria bacterium HGW-Alphaproteobacteria-16]|nr:MAG: hypothetical protein CVT77_16995 [Alphaproteobacteria bacterium HGW-Alphaproteobacteria-16]
MTGRGRPLRFVAIVAMGWTGTRLIWLWPDGATLPQAIEAVLPIDVAEAASVAPEQQRAPVPPRAVPPAKRPHAALATQPVSDGKPMRAEAGSMIADKRTPGFGTPAALPPVRTPPAPELPSRARPDRWSASAWFVTRRGAPASGPLLGGDQAGLRVAWLMDPRRNLSLYARATAPMAAKGRELALGVDWKPSRLPVRLVAERRIALDKGTMHGTAIGIVGGVDGLKLPHGFTLEAYGQGGVVARERIDPFADGALRVVRQVATRGGVTLELGAGTWGAAQPDSNRVDIGPSAVARLPIAGQTIRVALDWRERVAGNARPGSGPALTIGADF